MKTFFTRIAAALLVGAALGQQPSMAEGVITTHFKPSIHGWPFGNNWRKSFVYDTVTLDMGFCGGMCWRALQRFYNGIPIARDMPEPLEGDALYNELWDAQVDSVPASTLWDIFRWQESPDQGHWYRKDSQGAMTQEEWPLVKDRLDKGKPVTLTLIASSNDVNLRHLADSHRVVAYAYEERPLLDGEWVHGNRNPNTQHVAIFIYDPGYPDCDDIALSFYTGCEDSWINLRHSEGDEFHGFFLDDKDRDYASSDSTFVCINSCVQTGISSAFWASYDVRFSWTCRFIPYFCIRVDGGNWRNNESAKAGYLPVDMDDKQCQGRTGSETVKLLLPRALTRVEVRLLDADDYSRSVDVDARPAIDCYPYVHRDTAITDADLFIKDPQPTQAAVQLLDTSPFRWIRIIHPPMTDTRTDRDDLSRASIQVVDQYRLGNIGVPIFADFVERNLAPPTTRSGVVTISRRGQPDQTMPLAVLATQGQRIFDGFTDNPADYDNDTTVTFTYRSIDCFGIAATGKIFFYGRSIIYDQSTATIYVFDSAKVARLEAAARDLIERGLIDTVIELPQVPRPGQRIDPVRLMDKLRAHQQLQGLIDQVFRPLWKDPDTWKEIWSAQEELLKQVDQGGPIPVQEPTRPGGILNASRALKEEQQRMCDAVILNAIAQKAVKQICGNPAVIEELKRLRN